MQKNQNKSCSEYFTISPDSAYYKVFGLIVTLSCLTSPYFYAYIAAFRMSSHSNGTIMHIYYVYESLFLLNMVSQFFLEYQNEYTKQPIKDLGLIAARYLRTEFLSDFIPLIPLQILVMKNNRQNLFFLIKFSRLIKGLRFFDVPKMMTYIKKKYAERLEMLVQSDREFAENKTQDNT